MIVSTSRGGKCVKTWDPSNQVLFDAGITEARKLSFGFGNEFLVMQGSYGKASHVNLLTGTSIDVLPKDAKCLATSEAKPLLACIRESGIEIWDTQKWSLKATLLAGAPADAACFSADGTRLALSLVTPILDGPQFHIYNVNTGLCEWSPDLVHFDGTGSMALVAEGPVKALAFTTLRDRVCMVDTSKDDTHWYESGASASVAFINGGKQLLIVDGRWGGSVIDTASGAHVWDWSPQASGSRRTLLDMSFFKEIVNIDKVLAPELQFTALINRRHISRDGSWIMEGTERILWLPMQQRPQCAALSGSLLAIGTETGGFLLLEHKG